MKEDRFVTELEHLKSRKNDLDRKIDYIQGFADGAIEAVKRDCNKQIERIRLEASSMSMSIELQIRKHGKDKR